ncbi:MAG TPA: DMT family transporter [candidate division Zixibacteria bacterium]
MSESPARSSVLLLILGVLAVGPAAIFIRLAAAPPLSVAFYRMVVASVAIAIIVAVRGGRDLQAVDRLSLWRSVAAGVLLAFHFATWITSLDHTSVANSVIIVTTQPIFAALMGIWYLRERVRPAAFAAIVLALIGVLVIAGGNPRTGGWYGDLLALWGAIFASAYLVVGRQVRQRVSTLGYVVIAYSTAAVTLGIWGLVIGTPFSSFPAKTWFWMAAAGLIPSVIGHTIYNRTLKVYSAHTVGVTILSGETLVATTLAMIVFDEFPGPWAFVGAIPIIAGMVWSLRLERTRVVT